MSYFRIILQIVCILFFIGCGDDKYTLGSSTTTTTVCSNDNPGSTCSGGVIYVGKYKGYTYMTTPGGCNDSSTPTCDGSVDTLLKVWRGTGGVDTDVPAVENLSSPALIDPNSGSDNSTSAINSGFIDTDSAAHWCDNLSYGGYDDWFVPNIQELFMMYQNLYLIGGFSNDRYWTSSEGGTGTSIYRAYMRTDQPFNSSIHGKNGINALRCVRKTQ